jgi:hypothetical protein
MFSEDRLDLPFSVPFWLKRVDPAPFAAGRCNEHPADGRFDGFSPL